MKFRRFLLIPETSDTSKITSLVMFFMIFGSSGRFWGFWDLKNPENPGFFDSFWPKKCPKIKNPQIGAPCG